eukprot:sb/3466652/
MNESEINVPPALSIPLGVYNFIITLFGIAGNGLVLYSSLRYNAIQLDAVSLELVRNLALADMLYTICVPLPYFITLSVRRWVLGPVFCFIQGGVSNIPASVNALTVLAISAYRLKLIVSPFHGHISLRVCRVFIALIWMISFSSIALIMYYQLGAVFSSYMAACLGEIYDHDEARGLMMIIVGFIVFIPLVGIFGINLVLLGVAIRKNYSANSGINYKALFVILSLSGLFMLSWVPYLVFTIMKMKSPDVSPSFELIVFNILSLNTFGNPFLYTLTNRRFGRYVRGLLCGMFKSVGRNQQIAPRTGNKEENRPARSRSSGSNAIMQSSSV